MAARMASRWLSVLVWAGVIFALSPMPSLVTISDEIHQTFAGLAAMRRLRAVD